MIILPISGLSYKDERFEIKVSCGSCLMAVKPLCSPTQGSATRIPPKGIHQGRGPVSCLKKIRIKDAFI